MAEKNRAYFRFYGELNDFLDDADRQSTVRYDFWGRPAVKDAIEAQGIPHPEVDLILSNGTAVGFDAPLVPGARLSVYPWLQRLERPEESLRPPLPRPLRFVCDVHLQPLARHLRMLGFDTAFDSTWSDQRLATVAADEGRILLTRDIGLLKRGQVQLGFFVRSQDPEDQLALVVQKCRVDEEDVRPFDRCLDCNTTLESAPDSVISEKVPPHARRTHDEFSYCPMCGSVFWKGTHVDAMRRLMSRVFAARR